MERESNPMQSLCKSGCGFYGNPATDGLCSLCFKEALKKKQQPPVSAPSPSSVSTPARSSFMETATALPTVPCLPVSIIPASEHQAAEIMSQSHIPTESSKDCDVPSSNNSDTSIDHIDNNTSATVNNLSSPENENKSEPEELVSPPILPGTSDVADDGANNPGSSLDQSENDNSDKDDKDAKKKKNRCATCRKKVGLTGFECRCGGLFCAVHRYSDKHDCSFNYREMGAQEIRRNNPVVVGEKIQKI